MEEANEIYQQSKRFAQSGRWKSPPRNNNNTVSIANTQVLFAKDFKNGLVQGNDNEDDDTPLTLDKAISDNKSSEQSPTEYMALLLNAYSGGIEAGTSCILSKDELDLIADDTNAALKNIDQQQQQWCVSNSDCNKIKSKVEAYQVTQVPLKPASPPLSSLHADDTSNSSPSLTDGPKPVLSYFPMTSTTSYHKRRAREEDKRKERLERNRTSARIRRMKNKNMVENLTNEAYYLDMIISKLNKYHWNSAATARNVGVVDGSCYALFQDFVESLHIEQPFLEKKNRNGTDLIATKRANCESIREILQQQIEQVQDLLHTHYELLTLHWLVSSSLRSSSDSSISSSSNNYGEHQVKTELSRHLNLTNEQCLMLMSDLKGVETECQSLQEILMILTTIRDNELFRFSFSNKHSLEEEVCVDQFEAILNLVQINKLFRWTEYNSNAIEQLDFSMKHATSVDDNNDHSASFMFNILDQVHEP